MLYQLSYSRVPARLARGRGGGKQRAEGEKPRAKQGLYRPRRGRTCENRPNLARIGGDLRIPPRFGAPYPLTFCRPGQLGDSLHAAPIDSTPSEEDPS